MKTTTRLFLSLSLLCALSVPDLQGEVPGQERIPLWGDKAPVGEGQFEEANAFITVFRPEEPNGAAAVICPGGGYGGLVTGAEGTGIAQWLNTHGITGIVLEYRLPKGRRLVPLLDAQRAIRTVRTKAADWGIDPKRIGIVGFSAGGHLASTAATHFDDGSADAADPIERAGSRPDFAILVYPVITLGEKGHGGSRANLLGPAPTAEEIDFFSNEKQVSVSTPPTYLAHALDDSVVSSENSRMFYEALLAQKVATEYLELPSGNHGLNGYKGPMWDAWQSGSLQWLASLKMIPESEQPAEWNPTADPAQATVLAVAVGDDRELEVFHHGVKPAWGYAAPQEDTFVVIHPKEARENAPLYVVLHSAGHDVLSCVKCTAQVGNHDIYHSPDDFFALYVDCGANRGDWWWGGMHANDAGLTAKNSGSDPMPVERRVIDTVQWVMTKYGIDPNRVYLCGNSMGGSGTLGIGLPRGDVFAAIKANVPAGIEHAANRMFFSPLSIPDGRALPDPPVVIDYSAPNDGWSFGHDRFVQAMTDRKYPLYMYWGPFGHANNHSEILRVNDLINSFDWLNVKKNEAYPVFTNASSNTPLPWPDHLDEKTPGQINAFFRWKNMSDENGKIAMSLFLASPEDLQTTFAIPEEATADVSLRRIQYLRVAPGESFPWSFGDAHGNVQAAADGVLTIPNLRISAQPSTLTIGK
jgi:acetyl esterase/lipase